MNLGLLNYDFLMQNTFSFVFFLVSSKDMSKCLHKYSNAINRHNLRPSYTITAQVEILNITSTFSQNWRVQTIV